MAVGVSIIAIDVVDGVNTRDRRFFIDVCQDRIIQSHDSVSVGLYSFPGIGNLRTCCVVVVVVVGRGGVRSPS